MNSVPERKPTIRHSDDEREIVCDAMFKIMQSRVACSMLEAWNEAQDSLPAPRRNRLRENWRVPVWAQMGVEKRRRWLKERPSEPIARPRAASAEAPQAAPPITDVSVAMLEVLRGIKAELGNIRELVRRLQPKTEDELPEVIAQQKKRKPTVLMLGLLPIQQQEIIKAFGDLLDLRFTDEEGRVKDMGRNVDYIVGMKHKMSHSMEYAARAVNEKAYTAVPGGMSSLKGFLEDIWEQEEGAQ